MTEAAHPQIINPITLDIFDEIKENGTLGDMLNTALDLVEMYPGYTAQELLHKGIQRGLYSKEDPNQIRPRLTDLKRMGWIVVIGKRHCSRSDHTTRVSIYKRAYPTDTHGQLLQFSNGPVAIATLSHNSESREGVIHSSILYEYGGTYCTCEARNYHGYCKGTIGLKIGHYGVNSLSEREKGYLRRRVC